MWDIRDGVVGADTFIPKHVVIVTWKNMSFAGGIDISLYKVCAKRKLEIENSFNAFFINVFYRQTHSKWFWPPMKSTLTQYSTTLIWHGPRTQKLEVCPFSYISSYISY